jgi:hypothetical protein
MFSFELVYFTSHAANRSRLKIFEKSSHFFPGREFYGRSKKVLATQIWKDYNATVGSTRSSMRFKLLAVVVVALSLAGGVFAAIVVEKQSRQIPYVEVVDCRGVHSFVFRGPKSFPRKPILVPPQEYWTAPEAGLYKFVLRYHSGNVCSRLVTPEVFARYRVGDDYRDSELVTERVTEDSKSVQPVVHHRKHTAQLKKSHKSHSLAGRHRTNRTHRLALR